MKVFLIGATGGTGLEILDGLVYKDYDIKAMVRNSSKMNLDQFNVTRADQIKLVRSGVLEPGKLSDGLRNCDVVISALGTGTDNSYTEVYSEGGRNILAAMRANGIKRLITITSGLVDLSDPSTDNFFLNRIIRPSFNKIYYDMTRWETILDENCDIDWTCVRPTTLTDKKITGEYRVKENHCPRGGTKIGRADLADFILKQIYSREFIHKKPVVAY